MNQKFFNRVLCLLLVAVLSLSMVACSNTPAATEPATDPVTEAPTQEPTAEPTLPQTTVENPVTFFSLSYSQNGNEILYLTAYPDDNGGVYVEYVGDVKKVGTLDEMALHTLAAALADTKLADLNGQDVYEEGEAFASMYITFADESMLSANFGGVIPEEFATSYAAMDACFQALTAELPVYIPQPQIAEGTDETLLSSILEIMNGSEIDGLDSMVISNIAMDDVFGYVAGLSSSEGISAAASCTSMMMTTAYSLVIVNVKDAANIDAIRKDFEESLDWHKWVCVMPTNALIATNGNQVLCLMGTDQMFTATQTAIETAGWTDLLVLENPDM